jgi:outer membrane protein TolC/uncharacterized protein (DUF1684 family)
VGGRVSHGVAPARAAAAAGAADVEAVRLSLHAELALDYFELRGLDAERVILDDSVAALERALELTRNRYAGGIASQADVALAETQLESTRAQAIDLGARRAALEHAIAVLVGRTPASFQIAASPLTDPPPDIPAGLPSDLLERRPDIAAAERRVGAASAQVGVANAAFFPRLFLTASAGFESRSLGSWLTGLSGFWSAGPAAAVTLLDGGRRRAISTQAMAAYDESVADYKSTILQSLQDVEDSLAALRVLRQVADVQASAVAAADRALTLANNRYRGGVTSYLEVLAAQSAALANRRAASAVLARRLAASVLLIKALGGGWPAQSTRLHPRGVAPRTPLHTLSLAASPARSHYGPRHDSDGARSMRQLVLRTGLAAAVLAALTGCSSPPAAYPDQIAAWHAEKDRFMRESSESPVPAGTRATFPPLSYFPIDQAYRVPAALRPATSNAPIEMLTSTGQHRQMRRVGTLAFTLQGQALTLGAFVEANERDLRRLFVPFGDLTNGVETYNGGRYLELDRTATGFYDLDFNRAFHPFCLFNSSYDCPYPPPESRLKVPVRAGERLSTPKH